MHDLTHNLSKAIRILFLNELFCGNKQIKDLVSYSPSDVKNKTNLKQFKFRTPLSAAQQKLSKSFVDIESTGN